MLKKRIQTFIYTRDKSSPSSKCCDKSGIFKFGRKTIFSNKCNFESSSYFLELMGRKDNMKKILYVMNVEWNWIKQRPHFIAEGLSKNYHVEVLYRYWYNRKGLL